MAPRTPTPNPSLFETTVTPSATPATGFITAHCDGGARGNPGPAGYGVEITDTHGIVLAELSEFLGFRTNNYAEYSGLLASLQYALDHGHLRLRVVSDSELMVKQIQGKYKVNSPDLKPLWTEARARIARLASFEITHALRHKNKAADALANQAMDRGMRRGTPAESQPTITTPAANSTSAPARNSTTSRDGVQSLPLRAIPYPTKAETPPTPTTLDPKPATIPIPVATPSPVRTPAPAATPPPLLPSHSATQPSSVPSRSATQLSYQPERSATQLSSRPERNTTQMSSQPERNATQMSSQPERSATQLSSRPERSAVERPASPTPHPNQPVILHPDRPSAPATDLPPMLRGFTRDGVIHLLGPHTLPDGLFVKIIPE